MKPLNLRLANLLVGLMVLPETLETNTEKDGSGLITVMQNPGPSAGTTQTLSLRPVRNKRKERRGERQGE